MFFFFFSKEQVNLMRVLSFFNPVSPVLICPRSVFLVTGENTTLILIACSVAFPGTKRSELQLSFSGFVSVAFSAAKILIISEC